MFYILAKVWGGVTGSRTALLKSNGEVKEFDTQEQAQEEADRLNREMNGPYAKASFNYSVIPYETALYEWGLK